MIRITYKAPLKYVIMTPFGYIKMKMVFKCNKSNYEHRVVQMILISLDLIKERGKYYFFQAVQLTFAPH